MANLSQIVQPSNVITTSTLTATITPFTPTGGIVATNVQTALAELDADLTVVAQNGKTYFLGSM